MVGTNQGSFTSMAIGLSVALAASAVTAATVTTNAANEITYDIPAGETFTNDKGFSSAITKVVKTGPGTLAVTVSSTAFRGHDVEINGGYVKVSAVDALGQGNTIKVSSGAALWFTGANPGQSISAFTECTVEIAGDGPDHLGAFYRTGSSGGDKIITTLKVMSGATVGGDKRFGIATIDLNGYTLTNALTTVGQTRMYLGSTVKNPGHIVQLDVKNTLQSVVSWGNASSDNTWTVATPGTDGATIAFFSNSYGVAFPWSLLLESPLTLDVNADQVMSGPIVAKSGASMLKVLDDYYDSAHVDGKKLELGGSITGSPLIYKQTYTSTYKYEVDVTMSGERQELRSTILDAGSLSVTGGVYHALANDTGSIQIRNDGVLTVVDAGTLSTTNAPVTVFNSKFGMAGDKHAGCVARMNVCGDTEWALADSSKYSTVSIGDDGSSALGWGAFSITDGAKMDKNGFVVGGKGVGALYIRDSDVTIRDSQYFCYAGRHINIGTESGSYGYVGADDSTVAIPGGFRIAGKTGSEGHFIQNGGSLAVGDASVEVGRGGYGNFYLGNKSRFSMTAGTSGWCRFILGFEANSEIDPGVSSLPGGDGVMTVDGGATAVVSRIDFAPSGNRAQINLNGDGVLDVHQFFTDIKHAKSEGSHSILSFDGGTLKCAKQWQYAIAFPQDVPDETVVHGGGATVEILEGTEASCNLSFVRPSGKVFKSVAKPTDADFLSAVSVGPARLVFEDAAGVANPGSGASGFIAFDSKTGNLGEVVITSHGSGYHDGAKAYAILRQYPDRRFACAVVLEEEKSGGLTKTGGGDLYLKCVNTYEGATVVKGGTLRADVAGAIPSGTALRIDGGTLNLKSFCNTYETVEGTGGQLTGVKDGTLYLQRLSTVGCNGVNLGSTKLSVSGEWKVDATELAAAKARGFVATYPANVEFASGSTIEISGVADALDPAVDTYEVFTVGTGKTMTGPVEVTLKDDPTGKWKAKVSAKGVSVVCRKGLVLIVQ